MILIGRNVQPRRVLSVLLYQLVSRSGRYHQKNWVGVCGSLPKTLTLLKTKICDFLYPIYDLTKSSIPYLRPDP